MIFYLWKIVQFESVVIDSINCRFAEAEISELPGTTKHPVSKFKNLWSVRTKLGGDGNWGDEIEEGIKWFLLFRHTKFCGVHGNMWNFLIFVLVNFGGVERIEGENGEEYW